MTTLAQIVYGVTIALAGVAGWLFAAARHEKRIAREIKQAYQRGQKEAYRKIARNVVAHVEGASCDYVTIRLSRIAVKGEERGTATIEDFR